MTTKKQLYKEKLIEKGQKIIEYYTMHDGLSLQQKQKLDNLYIINSNGQVIANNNLKDTQPYYDFIMLLKKHKKNKTKQQIGGTAYIYTYNMLSCFLYMNKKENLPWTIKFHWEEVNVDSPLYNTYSLDKIVSETSLDYIEIYLNKNKKSKRMKK